MVCLIYYNWYIIRSIGFSWEKCSTHWCNCFMMIQWSVAVASTCLSALPQLCAQQIKTWILRSSWVMSDESSVMRQRNEATKNRRSKHISNKTTNRQATNQANTEPNKQSHKQPSKNASWWTIKPTNKKNQARTVVKKSLPCWVNALSGNKIENTRSLVEWPLLWRYLCEAALP